MQVAWEKRQEMSYWFRSFYPFLVMVHLLLEMLQNLAQSELYLDPAAAEDGRRQQIFSHLSERTRTAQCQARTYEAASPPLLTSSSINDRPEGMAFGKFASSQVAPLRSVK